MLLTPVTVWSVLVLGLLLFGLVSIMTTRQERYAAYSVFIVIVTSLVVTGIVLYWLVLLSTLLGLTPGI